MSLFNKPKRKVQVRKKVEDAEGSDDESSTRIEDIRELQRSREKKNGLSEIECAVGKEKAAALHDGIQMAGGTMAMTDKQKLRIEAAGIEAGIREQFEKETMLRDEHEELRKYIDQGIKKVTGTVEAEKKEVEHTSSNDYDVLHRVASKMSKFRSEGDTELLSEHMLAGIPEVDLGLSARITNILETEKIKQKMLDKALGKHVVDDEIPKKKRPRYQPRQ